MKAVGDAPHDVRKTKYFDFPIKTFGARKVLKHNPEGPADRRPVLGGGGQTEETRQFGGGRRLRLKKINIVCEL